MASYTYRCSTCGDHDQSFPMGTAPDHTECPDCREPARRVIAGPSVSLGDASARRLLDRTAASADTPAVVDSVPARPTSRRTPVTTNPLHARLPRP